MKRVKIMLTAISVLAVVGGALAFKAKRFQEICYYSTTTTAGTTTCPFRALGTSIGAVNPAGTFNTTKLAASGNCDAFVPIASCTVKHTIIANDEK